MEHQEGNELLLSRPRQTGRNTAFDQDTEPTKEFDAQGRSNSHPERLHMFERPVDLGFFACQPTHTTEQARCLSV
jgi:hypothetical protein